MPPTPRHTIVCTRKRTIARDVIELAFTKPEGFSFKAGQFVLWDVPLIENPADIQPRAYSIASAPSEKELLFVLRLTPGGRASRYADEVLEPGMDISIQGPFGFFTLKHDDQRELVFVCTSTGVAPFRSQILEALEAGWNKRIDLIFGARMEEDLFWIEELETIAKKYNRFFLHLALSNPSENYTGHRGRVQTLLPLIIKDFSEKEVYVCGNPEMTKELKALCLDQWKIEKKNLHVEGYI